MDLSLVESVTAVELANAGIHTIIGFTTADGLRVLASARRSTALTILRDAIGLGSAPGEQGHIETVIRLNTLTMRYDITFIIRTGYHSPLGTTINVPNTVLAPRPVIRRDRRAEAAAVRQKVKAKNAEKAWGEGKPMKGKMRVLGGKK